MGTLTERVLHVTRVVPWDNFSKDEILKLPAEAESQSIHHIAQSITEAIGKRRNMVEIESYEEIDVYGVKAVVNGCHVMVGNIRLKEVAYQVKKSLSKFIESIT